MRILGNILLVISLTTGALAAATAYHVPLGPEDVYPDSFYTDSEGNPLTIKSKAGVVVLLPETLAALDGKKLVVRNVKDPLNKRALSRLKEKHLKKVTVEEDTGLVLIKNTPVPLAKNKDTLTPELLKRLREQAESTDPRIKQRYVIVQEFDLAAMKSYWRWPGNWVFLASVVGLLAGALAVRQGTKKSLAAGKVHEEKERPETALLAVKEILDELRREVGSLSGKETLNALQAKLDEADRRHLNAIEEARPILSARLSKEHIRELRQTRAASLDDPDLHIRREELGAEEITRLNDYLAARSELRSRLGDEELLSLDELVLTSMEKEVRLRTIIDRLNEAQRKHMEAFIVSRPQLIERLGLAGFAELMDSYAAFERQVNRAWSAAADGVYEEAVECLDNASELLEETMDKLVRKEEQISS